MVAIINHKNFDVLVKFMPFLQHTLGIHTEEHIDN